MSTVNIKMKKMKSKNTHPNIEIIEEIVNTCFSKEIQSKKFANKYTSDRRVETIQTFAYIAAFIKKRRYKTLKKSRA
jgi:hypothetical protein